MTRLGLHGGRRGRVVLPGRGQSTLGLVVTSKAVDTRLDQDETELGVRVLAVLLKVAANVNSLLDEVVQVLRNLRGHADHLQDTQDLLSSDRSDLGDTLRVTQQDTDLRRGHALLGVLGNLGLDSVGIRLAPGWRRSAVRERRAGNALSLAVHTAHGCGTTLCSLCRRGSHAVRRSVAQCQY